MDSYNSNKTARELVIQGWSDGITLEEMASILQEAGCMVSPFVIVKTWLELDEIKSCKACLLGDTDLTKYRK